MSDGKPVHTPLPAGAVLEAAEAEAEASFRMQFQILMGSLLYACLGMRPDIAFAISRLGKYSANPIRRSPNLLVS